MTIKPVDEEKVKQFQVEVETIVEELKKGVEKRDKLKTMQVELEEQKNILAQERVKAISLPPPLSLSFSGKVY
jgi:hypothetical protein